MRKVICNALYLALFARLNAASLRKPSAQSNWTCLAIQYTYNVPERHVCVLINTDMWEVNNRVTLGRI